MLRQEWASEPDLVERIIVLDAFNAAAQRLVDAVESGFDAGEVLAEIPLRDVGSPRIHDPARFLASQIDVAVERIRTGEAAADAASRQAAFEREQLRDQAADLVREMWPTHPELAERVIHGIAFGAVVRTLDTYADLGLDVRDLLGSLNLAKLERIAHDPSRLATYSLRRVGERHLDNLHQAQQRAAEHAEATEHLANAAAVVRHAWAAEPEAAERIIEGPAFRYLAERMERAADHGFDVEAVLSEMDPIALQSAPSPSGAAAFAFNRKLTEAAPTRTVEARPDTEPAPQAEIEPETIEPDQPAVQPQPAPPAPDVGIGRSVDVPHWSERELGHMQTAQLRAQTQIERKREQELAAGRNEAMRRAEEIRADVVNQCGPDVTVVEYRLERARRIQESLNTIERFEVNWNAARDRAVDAARQRGLAEHDLAELGRWSPRRAELTRQIQELRAAEAVAQTQAEALAAQTAMLAENLGDRETRRQLQSDVRATEEDYPNAREAAQRRDREAAEAAQRRADRATEQHIKQLRRTTAIEAEQQLRDRMPAAQLELEERERAEQLTPAHPARESVAVHSVEVAGPEAAMEPTPHLQVNPPPAPETPEL
ncbi:LigA protein [Kutzneria sp. 744]|nr:LigA protein [Kutzneria sp. 744]